MYTGLGLTPEQVARINVQSTCIKRYPDKKLTDPAVQECITRGYQLLAGGRTTEEAQAIVATESYGTNWLLWGGIALGVGLVGYLVFFRR